MSWRGGALDRLLDEDHSRLVAATATVVATGGVGRSTVEVTYASFGERGSIDILAARASVGAVVSVEVKSELASDRGHAPQDRREGPTGAPVHLPRSLRVPARGDRTAPRASGHGHGAASDPRQCAGPGRGAAGTREAGSRVARQASSDLSGIWLARRYQRGWCDAGRGRAQEGQRARADAPRA